MFLLFLHFSLYKKSFKYDFYRKNGSLYFQPFQIFHFALTQFPFDKSKIDYPFLNLKYFLDKKQNNKY